MHCRMHSRGVFVPQWLGYYSKAKADFAEAERCRKLSRDLTAQLWKVGPSQTDDAQLLMIIPPPEWHPRTPRPFLAA
jgi:hypothetical protein